MENKRIRQLRRRIKTWHTAMYISAAIFLLALGLMLFAEFIMVNTTDNISDGNMEAVKYVVIGFALSLIPLMYNAFNQSTIQIQMIEDQIFELGNYLYGIDRLDEDNKKYFDNNILKSKDK